MSSQTEISEITEAVIDGSKAGAAAAVASDLTELVVVAIGKDKLPAFATTALGAKILPVIVCYLIAFGTVLIPGIPQAARVRKIAAYAAKGSAAILVADLMPSCKKLVPQVLGLAAMHGLDDAKADAKTNAGAKTAE